jgi:exonuclease III
MAFFGRRRKAPGRTLTVATWNLKQAVAPKAPLDDLWSWLATETDPMVAVLTEAKVPKTGVPEGWDAAWWRADGIGPRSRWGTVVASRGAKLVPIPTISVDGRTHDLDQSWPGVVTVADAIVDGDRWATVVGLYAITRREPGGESCGHGRLSFPRLLDDLEPLLASERGERLVLAGDLNMWPSGVPAKRLRKLGLTDLIEHTRDRREPLEGCSGCTDPAACGHLWTHKNGNKPGAKRQQLDYIFASEALVDDLVEVRGGIQSFPTSWDVSDHAPVVAEFRL